MSVVPKFKVALLGASGGIGQPLAMLLKMSKNISELALYDIKQAATPCVGVAADVGHMNTGAKVKGYAGDDEIGSALAGCNVVIITAGVPRKPGMTRDDLFNINAKIVKGLAESCVKHCPEAVHLIVSNPVNSTVPIACEVFNKAGKFNWRKIIGVTSLDCVRAATFLAEKGNLDPRTVNVPVVGGHAGETILPILSQASPPVTMTQEEIEAMDKHIQDAGTDVVTAKGGAGSATLSMAFAGARACDAVLNGMAGAHSVECCYAKNPEALKEHGVEYFAAPAEFGKNGIEKVLPLGKMTPYELKRLEAVVAKLKTDIKNGVDFAK